MCLRTAVRQPTLGKVGGCFHRACPASSAPEAEGAEPGADGGNLCQAGFVPGPMGVSAHQTWWIKALLLVVLAGLGLACHLLLGRSSRAKTAELRRLNMELTKEIAERQSAERKLREAHEQLERRVAERTAELIAANTVLQCEIQERHSVEQALKERLAFEDLIAKLASDFVRLRADEVGQGINAALAAVGSFTGVDGSYVFVFSDGGSTMSCTHEWVAEGISAEIDNLQRLPVDAFPWWMSRLRSMQNIYIPCVASLSEEAAPEKEILQAQSIQSLIVVPMVSGGELIGFLGFDSVRTQRQWPESFFVLLRVVGEMLGNAIARKRAEEQLRRTEERFRAIVEGTQAFLMNVDLHGRITYANDAAVRALGFTKQEEVLGQRYLRFVHPDDRPRVAQAYKQQVLTRQRSLFMEFRTVDKDGQVRWFSFMTNPMIEGDTVVGQNGVAQDITARKMAEETLAASLREKEMLLKEIHHRVKNNMQVVCSLLNLQRERVTSLEATQALRDSQNRIKSMALIHEKLYRSASLSQIDFGEYLQGLVSNLVRSYATNGRVSTELAVQKVELGVDQAIPCGLIVNELVSNALKHAFPGEQEGMIRVTFQRENGRCMLAVADNGVGFPSELDFRATNSLGMQLVTTLVDQLDGEIQLLRNGPGTHFSISFPAP
ncbi:MAG: histidine kinase dimerization/phosphoacceptor domain -containing protein [bacterium]|nr:histidine kinase dimerization/phosphoacceptor domain -containing protein [bacterium]